MSNDQYVKNHLDIIKHAKTGGHVIYVGYDPVKYTSGLGYPLNTKIKILGVDKHYTDGIMDGVILTLQGHNRVGITKDTGDRFKLVNTGYICVSPKNKPRNV